MYEHISSKFTLNEGDLVEVHLKQPANVFLVTEREYKKYCAGEDHEYFGGEAIHNPYEIVVPYSGAWRLVIDLGGGSGTLEYAVDIIPASA